AGPIGAVNTGAELLEEELDDPDPETLELIADSARKSAIRLKGLRLAFGSIAGKTIALSEGLSILKDSLEAVGKTLLVPGMPQTGALPVDTAGVRLVVNLGLAAADAWPRAATLGLTGERVPGPDPATVRFVVLADGAGPVPEAVQSALAQEGPAPDPRSVQFHWLGRLAEISRASLDCSKDRMALTLRTN
ncbi:MAG: histidine phosphotransferase family protein, partial [Rhodospirillaceae bacterium]